MKSLVKIKNFLEIISDENRLRILKYLAGRERCVCEIWESIRLSQNLTSYHLKTLKNFGLITSKKEGLNVIYKINKNVLEKNLKQLNNFLSLK